jgi:hypothetical protein
MKTIFNLFKKISIKPTIKQTCTNCKFNNEKYQKCVVGSFYAEIGLSKSCLNGELWADKLINDNNR